MENIKKQNSLLPMISVTVLFFMWGFITSLNDILIPHFKEVYSLSHFQANIVQLAFFIAYFVCGFIFFMMAKTKKDPIHKYGYKTTLLMGLMIEAVACCIFAFTAKMELSFTMFLIPLFLMGVGLTFLQIAANPFVSIIGARETASSRLNLTQAFNSLGTTLGPALGGYFISYFTAQSAGTSSAASLFIPYISLAVLLFCVAVFIKMSKIAADSEQEDEVTGKEESIFKKTYVVLGALGIFFYVGAEVTIGSNLVSYMKETVPQHADLAAALLSYYWGGAMIGRFLGAISLSGMKQTKKSLYMLLVAAIAFMVILSVTWATKGLVFHQVWFFLVFVVLNYIFFHLGQGKPALTLTIFTIVNMGLLLCGIEIEGTVGVWCLLGIGLFNSIMWGNVFTLAIDGLGSQTATASSMLVMMILGGAVFPPLQGLLADVIGIRLSYLLPLVSYAFLCFYGLKGYRLGKKN